MSLDAKRIINGTYTEIWLDDELLAEAKKVQAKININKEDVSILGKASKSKKMTGWDGTGSLTLNKVNSRMAQKIRPMLKEGKEVKCKIITKLADPDSFGSERAVLDEVMFDDLTLIDASHGAVTDVECPFTFEDYDFIDDISPQ